LVKKYEIYLNKKMKLVKNEKELRIPIEPKKYNSEQIEKISKILTEELENHGGIGLSSNQLGMKERICLINAIEPMILVNPRIVDESEKKAIYVEQCLSLEKTMKKPVKTIRYQSITVETDNLGTVVFSPDYVEGREWKEPEEFWADKGLLECVCAQHEIDHLNGKLITDKDRRYSDTVTSTKKYGRNERVMVKLPNGDTEFMKYKKAIPLLEVGCEIL
jgi:peptide deformylase